MKCDGTVAGWRSIGIIFDEIAVVVFESRPDARRFDAQGGQRSSRAELRRRFKLSSLTAVGGRGGRGRHRYARGGVQVWPWNERPGLPCVCKSTANSVYTNWSSTSPFGWCLWPEPPRKLRRKDAINSPRPGRRLGAGANSGPLVPSAGL